MIIIINVNLFISVFIFLMLEIRIAVSPAAGANLRKLPSSVKNKVEQNNNAGKSYIPIKNLLIFRSSYISFYRHSIHVHNIPMAVVFQDSNPDHKIHLVV